MDGVDVQWNLNEQTAFDQVEEQRARRGAAPGRRGAERREPVRRQQERFWVKAEGLPGPARVQLAGGPLREQRGNAQGRQLGLRPDGLSSAAGPYCRHHGPTSCCRASQAPYAAEPPAVCVALGPGEGAPIAAGHYKDGRVVVYYRSTGVTTSTGPDRPPRPHRAGPRRPDGASSIPLTCLRPGTS